MAMLAAEQDIGTCVNSRIHFSFCDHAAADNQYRAVEKVEEQRVKH